MLRLSGSISHQIVQKENTVLNFPPRATELGHLGIQSEDTCPVLEKVSLHADLMQLFVDSQLSYKSTVERNSQVTAAHGRQLVLLDQICYWISKITNGMFYIQKKNCCTDMGVLHKKLCTKIKETQVNNAIADEYLRISITDYYQDKDH